MPHPYFSSTALSVLFLTRLFHSIPKCTVFLRFGHGKMKSHSKNTHRKYSNRQRETRFNRICFRSDFLKSLKEVRRKSAFYSGLTKIRMCILLICMTFLFIESCQTGTFPLSRKGSFLSDPGNFTIVIIQKSTTL